MQKIKTGYIYFFCVLYNTFKKLKGQIFAPDFQAVSSMMVLEGILGLSIFGYIITIRRIDLGNFLPINLYTISFVIIVALLHYFIFYRKDKWKQYIMQFDELSKEIRIRYSVIVWLIVILIFASLILSVYLMGLIGKSADKEEGNIFPNLIDPSI